MTVQSPSGELSLTNVGEQTTHVMYVIVSLAAALQDCILYYKIVSMLRACILIILSSSPTFRPASCCKKVLNPL
jgi:hypothetical protein